MQQVLICTTVGGGGAEDWQEGGISCHPTPYLFDCQLESCVLNSQFNTFDM